MIILIKEILVIAIGGAFGSAARFLVARLIQIHTQNIFGASYGILTVNTVGSFLIGFLSIILIEKFKINPLWQLAILVGFLGGFTTFSSFSLDVINIIRDGYNLIAASFIMGNIALCLLAAWLGILIGSKI
ncbi:MAG: fluoride efflux transporter CrcB [Gammaproteobacteria bacterium]|nr:fluoride efflux transporter CrcB [Gammaproteobacteria bacterium]